MDREGEVNPPQNWEQLCGKRQKLKDRMESEKGSPEEELIRTLPLM